ncbi:MAG: DMT family transporter [Kiritimatiellia bacterium]
MDSRTLKGAICLIVSAFGFALMGLFVRMTDDHGAALSAFQKGFFRNAVAFVLALALFLKAGRGVSFGEGSVARRGWVLLLRAAFGTAGIFGNFYALSRIDLADAMMLNKLAPFFTVLFSWLFIKEKVSARQALCLVGALVGAALVVKPGLGAAPLVPALCGLFGGLCAGAAYACVHELGILKMDGRFIVLFFSAFSCLASVPFLLFDFQPMTAAQVWILCGAGAGAAVGQFGVTAAYRYAEPRRIAVFDYTNILFAAGFGYLAFGQVPDALSWAGFVLIAGMAVLIRRSPKLP